MPLQSDVGARAQFAATRGGVSAMDLAMGLADVLPSGLYTGAGIEKYLAEGAERTGPDRRLPRARLRALPDGDRPRHLRAVVFGVEGMDDVPISTAVRASGALPMVYSPVEVGDRELIDGGIVSTTNLDLAVQAGAKLVVVINPIVPFVNDFAEHSHDAAGPPPAARLGHGLRRRSATRSSSSSPISACTNSPRAGRSATPASTSC